MLIFYLLMVNLLNSYIKTLKINYLYKLIDWLNSYNLNLNLTKLFLMLVLEITKTIFRSKEKLSRILSNK